MNQSISAFQRSQISFPFQSVLSPPKKGKRRKEERREKRAIRANISKKLTPNICHRSKIKSFVHD